MTTNPPTSCATGPTDGQFFSPYPNYFSFSNPGAPSIEQGHPGDPTDNVQAGVYAESTIVDVGGQFVSQEAAKSMNDFVPLGTQVAWDQGATTSDAIDHSMGMTSPMSQTMSMPLIPGISSFGPILNTWPMPPVQRRQPSKGEPTPGQQSSKKRKQSASGNKNKDDASRTLSTAGMTIPPTSPEDEEASSKDTVMTNSQNDIPTASTTLVHAGFATTSTMMEYNQPEEPESPPRDQPGGVRLATQRARNRVAANKFRKKSKAAVAELEAVERGLSAQHEHLSLMVRDLREEVLGLKNELLLHGNCDCPVIHRYLSNTASRLSLGCAEPSNKASLGDLPSVTPSTGDDSSGSK